MIDSSITSKQNAQARERLSVNHQGKNEAIQCANIFCKFKFNGVFDICLFGVFLFLPFFNDFPLFRSSNLFRSPTALMLLLFMFTICCRPQVFWKFFLDKYSKLSFLFLAVVLFEGLSNYPKAINLHSYTISGDTVLIKSISILSFCIISSFFVSRIINTYHRLSIALLGITTGCIVSLLYGVIEYFTYSQSYLWAIDFNSFIEPLIHHRPYDYGVGKEFRLRATAFEPSYYGLYLSFVVPFIFYLAAFEKKKYWVLLLFVMAASFLSYSRTAQISIGVEFLLFAICIPKIGSYKSYGYLKKILLLVFVFSYGFIAYGAFTSLFTLSEQDISNVTRISSQVAAIRLFGDFPLLGIGFGLAGAYLPDYYPDFAWLSYEAVKWAALRNESLSTPVFAMLPRLLAEIGIVGCAMFFLLIFSILSKLYHIMKSSVYLLQERRLAMVLFISIIGQGVASFGVDTIVFQGYWLSLSLASGLIYVSQKKHAANYIK